MKSFIIRVLGLRGSWTWAVMQMIKGNIVYRTTDTGTAKYRLSQDKQNRIEWAFKKTPNMFSDWDNANIFLDDFRCTSWEIL